MRQNFAWVCLTSLVLVSGLAQAAALGEKSAEVAAQSAVHYKAVATENLKTSLSAKTSSLGAAYSVRETVSDIRTLKEFINSDGVTFAISWTGSSAPNFSEIFGRYYAEFKSVRDAKKIRSRRVMSLKTSSLVVSSVSYGVTMSGLAYIPSLLPVGLIAEELK